MLLPVLHYSAFINMFTKVHAISVGKAVVFTCSPIVNEMHLPCGYYCPGLRSVPFCKV